MIFKLARQNGVSNQQLVGRSRELDFVGIQSQIKL
jgi:hypothetical protein